MRIKREGTTIKLWLSAKDTYAWATRLGLAWPGSQLAGKRLYAEFDDGELVGCTVNGKAGMDISGVEFTAITVDFIEGAGQ